MGKCLSPSQIDPVFSFQSIAACRSGVNLPPFPLLFLFLSPEGEIPFSLSYNEGNIPKSVPVFWALDYREMIKLESLTFVALYSNLAVLLVHLLRSTFWKQ